MNARHSMYAMLCCQLAVSGFGFAPVHAALTQPDGDRGFEIATYRNGDWRNAGFILFDNLFREQSIRLGIEGQPLTLRLKKVGPGPGHVDFARINGSLPNSIRYVDDPVPLAKLAAKDFDVVHVPEETGFVEIQFPTGGELRLAARVEGKVVSETPFRFPPSNFETPITDQSDFYTLTLEKTPRLIFSEETSPGTGHPWAMTTASAMIREDMLHVRLDFAPDNTLDGGKDYASLHLRTAEGVKTYTITQNDHRWGKAGFSYTPAVPWQHKLYDFIIPLAQLPDRGKIELAMSAYGTAGPGPYDPALAYGAKNRQYMAAYYYYAGGTNVSAQTQRYDSSGNPVGAPFDVTISDANGKTEEAIAYDSVNDRFLVAWIQDDHGVGLVHRQLVSSTNSLVGSMETNASPVNQGQRYPAVAYSPASRTYLNAWQENINAAPFDDIYGITVDKDNQGGAPFVICSEASYQSKPRIAYAPTDDTFLVVWEDRRNDPLNADIYIGLVKPDGSTLGISTAVTAAPGAQLNPDIAYDPDSNLSLVVWQDTRNQATTAEDIYGQILANGVMQVGNELIISDAPGEQWLPQVAYAGKGIFLVIWEDRNPVPHELRGRFYTSTGTPLGGEKVFVRLDGVNVENPVLAGNGEGTLLIAYNYYDLTVPGMQIGTHAVAAPASGRIFLHLPAILNGSRSEEK